MDDPSPPATGSIDDKKLQVKDSRLGLLRKRSSDYTDKVKSGLQNTIAAVSPMVEGLKDDTKDFRLVWTARGAEKAAKASGQKQADQDISFNPPPTGLEHLSLCSHCEKFPIERCLYPAEFGRVWTIPMKRLVSYRYGCRLCNFLVRILSQPRHDPFKHPQILDYLPNELTNVPMEVWLNQGTLANPNWLNTYMSDKWPFGTGEIFKSEKNIAEGSTHILGNIGRVAISAIQTLQDGSPSSDKIIRALLPCYLEFSNNALAPGLLDVKLWGHGRGPRAQIATLSAFRLRMESEKPTTNLEPPQLPFHYGRILKRESIDISIGRDWLNHCEETHGATCSERGWSFALKKPTFLRVIDVEEFCLFEVPSSEVATCRYLALSYCWGKADNFLLQMGNKGELSRRHGLLPYIYQGLPKTVRDAIFTARGLQERYLWVDSLCIEQDNEEEKSQQIAIMDSIYSNAVLTIVAADGKDVDSGLPGIESGSRSIKQETEEIYSGHHIMTPLEEPKGLETSPWNLRAWTFQERLLSRRLIIFIGGQMVWRCHEAVGFEDMTAAERGEELEPFPWLSIKPQHLGIKTPRKGYIDGSIEKLRDGRTIIVRSETFKEYVKLIEQYTQRQLTNPSDILKALAGLLNIFERCFKRPTNQGLPEILLDAAILWRPVEKMVRRSSGDIPSWSWAGWVGKVQYEDAFFVREENGKWSRVPNETGNEGFRPLLRWHVWRDGRLELLNGNGLGVPLELDVWGELPDEWEKRPPISIVPDEQDQSEEWNEIMKAIELSLQDVAQPTEYALQIHNGDLPRKTLPYLRNHHLIFRTSCTPGFLFGPLMNYEGSAFSAPLSYCLLDTTSRAEIGLIMIDGLGFTIFNPVKHEFIVLSEAQYLTLDEKVDQEESSAKFSLYNVMLIEWDDGKNIASRLGLGRIYKESWKTAVPAPQTKIVILG